MSATIGRITGWPSRARDPCIVTSFDAGFHAESPMTHPIPERDPMVDPIPEHAPHPETLPGPIPDQSRDPVRVVNPVPDHPAPGIHVPPADR